MLPAIPIAVLYYRIKHQGQKQLSESQMWEGWHSTACQTFLRWNFLNKSVKRKKAIDFLQWYRKTFILKQLLATSPVKRNFSPSPLEPFHNVQLRKFLIWIWVSLKLPKSTGASLWGVTYVVNSATINCLQAYSCGFPSTLKHTRRNLSVSRGGEREERGWCQGKGRCLQPAWKDGVFTVTQVV